MKNKIHSSSINPISLKAGAEVQISPAAGNTSQTIAIKQIPSISKPVNSKIYIREQKGYFQRLRTSLNSLLIAAFFLLPLIQYQGRQAVLFDLNEQQFYFFGTTLWPQDFTLLAWIFITAAFLLFFITAFLGRVWCGYLCPQTAWTFIFVWIENRIEGGHNKRRVLDKSPWTRDKIIKRTSKHLLWGLIALLTGCGFIAYFVPATSVYPQIFGFSASPMLAAWVWFFAICTYINAAWMREMVCLHLCPYARFQSAMFDANTITVAYDPNRGESRGPRKRKQATDLGDCVDCNLCVDVCPTGIDIRNGLQYECINCGACVDACDQTMDKFGYARNLIGYRSENHLKGQNNKPLTSLKFLGYGIAAMIMLSVVFLDIYLKKDIQLNVIRDRQSLYRETLDDKIENSYTLKVRNKTQNEKHYRLSLSGDRPYSLQGSVELKVKAGEQLTYPLTVYSQANQVIDQGTPSARQMSSGMARIVFQLIDTQDPSNQISQDSNFFTP
ncbi:cytochrome c oxidase accessory protein CcoG [Shewanella benthica]|nr:cytochrome c oxidase accessory protein CcoG [Shewanella benthica]MBE7213791.1 cytochrome c oxidase accessory protein CcoG [Shewanella benthica]MCL1061060.1 cytochrome c oxidase accessory protein CcoG [Shewanella benthica]